MALTVEDGTGLASADAFISVSYADDYHSDLGNTAWGNESDQQLKEQAIRRATVFISAALPWKGLPVQGRDQALAWPRAWVTDENGYAVDSDVVPVEIKKATAEVALRELANPGALSPDYTPSTRKKSVKVGPIRIEYDMSRTDAASVRPILLAVRNLVGPLLNQGASNKLAGESTRV